MKRTSKNIFFACLILLYLIPICIFGYPMDDFFKEKEKKEIYETRVSDKHRDRIFSDNSPKDEDANYFEKMTDEQLQAAVDFNENNDWDSGLAIGENTVPLENGIYFLLLIPLYYLFFLRIKRKDSGR
ncbi:MAG: hypothetical protein LUG18_08000 [Candidatus Azobacteroides sp.]|nr:hypothetical protein [Candidatus Azobacteroides sp.]